MQKHKEALTLYNNKQFLEALQIWKEESQNNNHQAMTNVGLMYLNGEGVEKDFTQAKEWFEKAAHYDNASALYNLALMYQNKIEVEHNDTIARDYFARAAKQGHKGASFRLGFYLLQDKTNIKALKQGFALMLTAAKGGNMMAKIQVKGIEESFASTPTNTDFFSKEKEAQLKEIQEILNAYIMPTLIQDGGSIILVDFIPCPSPEMYLVYGGQCSSCSLAATSTYTLIKNTIAEKIDPSIKVYVI